MATSDPLMIQIQLSNASEKTHARVAMLKTHPIQLSDKKATKVYYVHNER